MQSQKPKQWLRCDQSVVSCTESIKVLDENWEEARSLLQEMFEDAVLLGCGKAEYKAQMHRLVDTLSCDYEEKKQPVEAKKRTPAE